jgi:hypothetical protein
MSETSKSQILHLERLGVDQERVTYLFQVLSGDWRQDPDRFEESAVAFFERVNVTAAEAFVLGAVFRELCYQATAKLQAQ